MVLVEVNSLVIAALSLIPTMVFAFRVERHFTVFWRAAWNLFAIFLSGLSLLLVPAVTERVAIIFDGQLYDLFWILMAYAIVMALFLFKGSDKARNYVKTYFAGSKTTAGILSMVIFAQYFLVNEPLYLISILIGVALLLYFLSRD